MEQSYNLKYFEQKFHFAGKNGYKLALWPVEGGFQWQWQDANQMVSQIGSTTAATKEVALIFAVMSLN